MGSLRAGSIAGRRRIVIGLRRAWVRRGIAAAVFALRARGRRLLADGNSQPFYPSWIGIEHLDLEIARARNYLAAHRQPADLRDQVAAKRRDLVAGLAGDEILADHRAGIFEAGAGVRDEGIVRLPHDCRRLVAVMLVVDLADDLFDDVLDLPPPLLAPLFVA